MLLALLLAVATPRPFHLTLESNAAATFPLLRRFGTITVDVYPHGFRAKSVWLRAFSRNGTKTITFENPVSRTYVEKPMSEVGDIVRLIGGRRLDSGPPAKVEVTSGNVGRLASKRYRLIYDTNQFIDVWTTTALGPTPQFRAFADEIVLAISPESAKTLRGIPGTPIYVEVNMGEYRKVAVLKPRGVVYNSSGEATALQVSPFMFPAPFGTIFK